MAGFQKYFTYFFGALAVLEIATHLFNDQLGFVHWFTKPLIMIFLLIHWAWGNGLGPTLWNRFVHAAFIFSWLGDIFLMFKPEIFFLLGLGSFLIAQLCYAWCFQQQTFTGFGKHMYWVSPLLLMYGISLLSYLWGDLGGMKIPVTIYATAILTMGFAAINRLGSVSRVSFYRVAIGAVLFILSDSLIAINTFSEPIPYSGVWIMSTYIGAQFFIVKGLLRSVGK